jgi:hypothetical protein
MIINYKGYNIVAKIYEEEITMEVSDGKNKISEIDFTVHEMCSVKDNFDKLKKMIDERESLKIEGVLRSLGFKVITE